VDAVVAVDCAAGAAVGFCDFAVGGATGALEATSWRLGGFWQFTGTKKT
jgi:hypothetical protein